MSYLSPVDLDLLDADDSDKAGTLNGLLSSLAAAALFGIKGSDTYGLTLTLYGGVMLINGTPTVIATQSIVLTANATNYVYATSIGVVTKTTSVPSGWPNITSPVGAFALYELVTGSSAVESGENYVPNVGPYGPSGEIGEQGERGSQLRFVRGRALIAVGGGVTTTTTNQKGFPSLTTVGTTTNRSLGTSAFRATIPYVAWETSGSAGSTASIVPGGAKAFYLGNGAGRGGFDVQLRWCMENSFSPANGRCFFGLTPPSNVWLNVEPDAQVNIIGVGANAGESNLSILHNDGSGTATKTLITSVDSPSVNFPAKGTDNVYDLRLTSIANSQVVTWRLTNVETGVYGQGTISTNLPSNTTYMNYFMWVNNGSTASAHAFGFYRVVSESRY